MNRRNFFRLLTGALATPALAPLAKLLPAPIELKPVIGSYANYVSASDISFESSIDPTIDLLTKYYSSSMLANLKAQSPMLAMLKEKPSHSGKTIQFCKYNLTNKEKDDIIGL